MPSFADGKELLVIEPQPASISTIIKCTWSTDLTEPSADLTVWDREGFRLVLIVDNLMRFRDKF